MKEPHRSEKDTCRAAGYCWAYQLQRGCHKGSKCKWRHAKLEAQKKASSVVRPEVRARSPPVAIVAMKRAGSVKVKVALNPPPAHAPGKRKATGEARLSETAGRATRHTDSGAPPAQQPDPSSLLERLPLFDLPLVMQADRKRRAPDVYEAGSCTEHSRALWVAQAGGREAVPLGVGLPVEEIAVESSERTPRVILKLDYSQVQGDKMPDGKLTALSLNPRTLPLFPNLSCPHPSISTPLPPWALHVTTRRDPNSTLQLNATSKLTCVPVSSHRYLEPPPTSHLPLHHIPSPISHVTPPRISHQTSSIIPSPCPLISRFPIPISNLAFLIPHLTSHISKLTSPSRNPQLTYHSTLSSTPTLSPLPFSSHPTLHAGWPCRCPI